MIASSSLLVGTFNAQFLPRLLSDWRRARQLAARIQRAGYDVIALNEVFDNGVRRVLATALRPEFPHQVTLARDSRWWRKDSGLMLLTRHPFSALPTTVEKSHGVIRATSQGATDAWRRIAFAAFERCAHTDCLAAKGVAMVRLTTAKRPLNVLLLHMQASYAGDDAREVQKKAGIRRSQLDQLRGFIETTLGAAAADREDVIITGDFNIDGRGSRGRGVEGLLFGRYAAEWQSISEVLSPLFPTTGLVDVWHRFAPPEDPGLTYPAHQPAARMDYIWWSPGVGRPAWAVQQVGIAYHLRQPNPAGGAPIDLSDHLGVDALFALEAEDNGPDAARDLGEITACRSVSGQIGQPGNVQWFVIHGPADVHIVLDAVAAEAGVRVEAYRAGDISTPLAGEVVDAPPGATRHRLTRERHFIRVHHPQRRWSGRYEMQVSSMLV